MAMKLSALLNPSEDTAKPPGLVKAPAPEQSSLTNPEEQQHAPRPGSSDAPQAGYAWNHERDGSQHQQNAYDAASALAALAAGPPAMGLGYPEDGAAGMVKADECVKSRNEFRRWKTHGSSQVGWKYPEEPKTSITPVATEKMEEVKTEEPQVQEFYDQVPANDTKSTSLNEPPSELPPMDEPINPDLDEATKAAIQQAQNEHGTRTRPKPKITTTEPAAPMSSPPPPQTATSPEAAPPPKKRPKNISNRSKPGGKKPPPKRLKLGPSSTHEINTTPNSAAAAAAAVQQSGTPNSATTTTAGKTPKTATPAFRKNSKSATPGTLHTPDPTTGAASSDAGSDSDSGILYCICRKPDNHTWMIGCDGACDDWYHAKCIAMHREDEDLLDKYYCPTCTERGIGITTWKPMCRRDGCRHPARLRKGDESKYCCDECGVAFMREVLGRCGALNYTPAKPKHKSAGRPRTPGAKRIVKKEEDAGSETEADIGPLGGMVRAHELKALVLCAPDISRFRGLGSSGMPTPPPSTSPEDPSPTAAKREADFGERDAELTEQERGRLAEIAARKGQLRERRALLKERERLVVMTKERAARARDVCGYDARLSWDDVRFVEWRGSDAGRVCFERGSLEAPDSAGGGDGQMLKPRPGVFGGGFTEDGGPGRQLAEGLGSFCRMKPKRCSRHGVWQKGALQDVRFEEADVGDEMRRIDREEREIRMGASGRGRMGGDGVGTEQRSEDDDDDGGWAEVCDDETEG